MRSSRVGECESIRLTREGDRAGKWRSRDKAQAALTFARALTCSLAASLVLAGNALRGPPDRRRRRPRLPRRPVALVLRQPRRARDAGEPRLGSFDAAGADHDPEPGARSISTSRSPRCAASGSSSPSRRRRHGRSAENPTRRGSTPSYVALLARTYPTVKDFIVGNEPNQPRFWQPQFNAARQNVSAGRVLRRCSRAAYDALKAVDPAIRVDRPRPLTARQRPAEGARTTSRPRPSASSTASARRTAESGRHKPIMDELAFHPYPDQRHATA